MKRILIVLVSIILSVSAWAESQWYNSKSYAVKQVGYSWSDWQACDVNIKFDLSTDWITIYSNRTQYYKVVQYHGDKQEYDGSYQSYFTANDSNGGVCTIRLRVETNGNSQIYIEYSNAMWVYNVIRVQ
jgi:hypothetical protein